MFKFISCEQNDCKKQDQVLRSCATFAMGSPCRAAVRTRCLESMTKWSFKQHVFPVFPQKYLSIVGLWHFKQELSRQDFWNAASLEAPNRATDPKSASAQEIVIWKRQQETKKNRSTYQKARSNASKVWFLYIDIIMMRLIWLWIRLRFMAAGGGEIYCIRPIDDQARITSSKQIKATWYPCHRCQSCQAYRTITTLLGMLFTRSDLSIFFVFCLVPGPFWGIFT